MQIIETSQGSLSFEPKEFTLGSKIINREISKNNLLLFQNIMKKHRIQFSLAYGTLLGAVREDNFIAHDEDTDVAILEENKNRFLDSLFALEKKGFIVGRYGQGLLSIIREGEYIDIYIFRKKHFGYRQFGNEVVKEKYLLSTTLYSFLGSEFSVPEDYIGYLEEYYGKDWKVPKENFHAFNPSIYFKIKQFVRNNFKLLFLAIVWVKNKLS